MPIDDYDFTRSDPSYPVVSLSGCYIWLPGGVVVLLILMLVVPISKGRSGGSMNQS